METLLAVLLGYTLPGFAIAFGILAVTFRLSIKNRLWLYGHPLVLEVGGTWIAWLMHGGTLVGGMAVVMAGICIYLSVCLMRGIHGFVQQDQYYRGIIKYTDLQVFGEPEPETDVSKP